MTKADLVRKVADNAGMTSAYARIAVEAVLDEIVNGVRENKGLCVQGFGVFKAVEKPARVARNPKTGAAVDVPAKTVIKFVPKFEI